MMAGGLLVSLSLLGLWWVQSVFEAVAVQFAGGIGTAMWNISRHSFLAEAIRSDRRGRASAFMGGINRVTSFFTPAAGGVPRLGVRPAGPLPRLRRPHLPGAAGRGPVDPRGRAGASGPGGPAGAAGGSCCG